MNTHYLSRACSLLALTLFITCSEPKDEEPAPFDPKFTVIESIDLTSGPEGAIIPIKATYLPGKSVQYARVGGIEATVSGVTSTHINIVVPYQPSAGLKDIVIKMNLENEISKPAAFEFLPMSIASIQDSEVRLGGKDTFSIVLNNSPAGLPTGNFSFVARMDGSDIDFGSAFSPISLTGNVLKVASHTTLNSEEGMTHYLRYQSDMMKVTGVTFVEMVRIYRDANNYTPDEQIMVLTHRGFNDLQGFIDGQEIAYQYSVPINTIDGYNHITAFRTPVKASNEYDLTVKFTDENAVAPMEGSNKIKINDMYHCAQNGTYVPGASMKIFLEGGDNLNEGQCYECPVKFSLWDIPHQTEFVTTLESKSYVENTTPGMSYAIVKIPANIPTNALYKIEVKTQGGYIYKLKAGCANEAIQILP
jgi:hypothetical protein